MHKVTSKPLAKMLVKQKFEDAGWTEAEYNALPDGTNEQLMDIAIEVFGDLYQEAGGRTKLEYSPLIKPGIYAVARNTNLIEISSLHKMKPVFDLGVTIGHELIHAIDYYTCAIGNKDYYIARGEQSLYNGQVELSEIRAYRYSYYLSNHIAFLGEIGRNFGDLFDRAKRTVNK